MIPAYVGHHSISLRDQRYLGCSCYKTRRRSIRDTSCFKCTCAFIVFFQKTRINLPWTRKHTTTKASIPSAFSFSFFLFFGNGVGEHAKGGVVTLCKEIQDSLWFWIPRPKFRIPGTGFRSLLVKFGLYRLSRSGFQNQGFRISHKKKFSGYRIQISPTWCKKRRRLQSTP